MPIVRIDIQAGKSTAYKRSLLAGVRSAVTGSLGLPDDRVMQRIVETPAEDIDTTDIRSDRLTIVEISMVGGRGAELKERLYRALSKRLGLEPGIAEQDLIVVVNDPPGECFYVNGVMQCASPTAAPAVTPARPETEKDAEATAEEGTE